MGAYKADADDDSRGAAPEEARTTTMSGTTNEHAERQDIRRNLSGGILSRGHVTVKSLISTNLAADILDGVSMARAAVISNALQQNLPGELRKRCEEELRSSSALADLVEQVFGVRTFRVSTPKRLSTPCLAEAQMPHADDFCNRELIAIVQLREGQQPTEAIPYDAAARYPTGVFVPCTSCQALGQVSDAELRRREADATTFQCEECACGLGLDGATGPRDLDGCERAFASTAFKAFAGPLLERRGRTLLSVQQAMRPCSGPDTACGDAVVALPTLIHRGPGNTSATQTRDVLFFTLQPTGFPQSRHRSKACPVPRVPDDDLQVSAPWLLTMGERTGQLQPGLYERIVASYARRGVSFEQFLVEEDAQPKQKRRKTDRDGGGGNRDSLVSLFRPPRKAAGRTSSSHDAAESSEAAEGVHGPEARTPIPASSEGSASTSTASPSDEADETDVVDGVDGAASSELWVKGSKVEALDGPGTWYEASVVDERGHGEARELLVHYKGWKARYDE